VTIDVSDNLIDPDFAIPMLVQRRIEVVGNDGLAVITPTVVRPWPFGVVVPKDSAIGGNELTRSPEADYRGAALVVRSTFAFRSAAETINGVSYKPDVLWFRNDPYLCTLVNNYLDWGAGWIEAEFISMDSIDAPPDERPDYGI